jgi:hypothetical protein
MTVKRRVPTNNDMIFFILFISLCCVFYKKTSFSNK